MATKTPTAPVDPSPQGQEFPTPATVAESDDDKSARAIITSALAEWGLEQLGDWAWGRYLELGKAGVPLIFLEMKQRPEYTARFPAMAELAAAGHAINESQYIQAEASYKEQMRSFGLPASFYDDPTDFHKLIAGNVGAKEFNDRLVIAEQAAANSPDGQEMRDQLARLYGLSNAIGLTTAYWIDPDVAAPVIKQQYIAAKTAAASQRSGFGSLTLPEAEKYSSYGADTSAFGTLTGLLNLTTQLPGDVGNVDRTDLLDAGLAGDALAQKKIQDEAKRRAAVFQAGGSYAAGQEGMTGLGTSQT